MIRRIKVCLNGGRGRQEHRGIPVTAPELAASAASAVAVGAEAVHLHPRGDDEAESLRPHDVAEAVTAVGAACPGVPVGVSTGLWITGGNVRLRRALVAGWADLPVAHRPAFASVNVAEAGFTDLVEVLHGAGIAVEAGVWSVRDADRLAGSDTTRIARILVEIIGVPAGMAAASADAVLRRLDGLGVDLPRLLHGEGAACWPLVTHAGRLGLPTRIGLEDTLVGPDGRPATSNAELVRLALARWSGARAGLSGSRLNRPSRERQARIAKSED